jgi:DNA end-binding protein Ku
MPQAVWVGELSFGLVNIPVRLFTATSPQRVRFHQYDAETGRRVRYRRVAEEAVSDDIPRATEDIETTLSPPEAPPPAPSDEAEPSEPSQPAVDESPPSEPEVAWEDIVKGYEVEPGRVVMVESQELESVAPERSRVLEVEQFVDLAEIDPVYFEKSYYVVPQAVAVTQRPYWLLYRAMEEAGKVAIGRFVMRTKEYLVAVRPAEHLLMLETLFYPDEVRDPKEVWMPSMEEPSERELRLARQLIESLSGPWEPGRHRDEHRERVLELLRSKTSFAAAPSVTVAEQPPPQAAELMEALQASFEAAKRAREERA